MSNETPENGGNVVKLAEVIKKRRGRPKKAKSGPEYPRDVPGYALDGLDLEILSGLDIDEDEKPFRTAFNLYRIVSQFSASRDIHFCELNGELRFGDDPPPFAQAGAVVKKEDFTRIRILISGCFGLDFRIADLTQAVEAYGDGRRRDPVRDWLLECLAKWQEKQRRENLPDNYYTDWLTRFAGAPDKRIYNRIGEMLTLPRRPNPV